MLGNVRKDNFLFQHSLFILLFVKRTDISIKKGSLTAFYFVPNLLKSKYQLRQLNFSQYLRIIFVTDVEVT